MSAVEVFRELFQKADASGSKSTVMRALGWVLASLVTGLIASNRLGGEPWVTVYLGFATGLVLLVFLFFFCWFAVTDPDRLQSEKFTLSKMALDRGRIGDNGQGFTEAETQATKRIESTTLGRESGEGKP